VGNALETKEAILTLKGEGPEDFTEHCLEIASHMLVLGKRAETQTAAHAMAKEVITNGSGLAYLKKLVAAQGGDVRVIDDPGLFPEAPVKGVVDAGEAGFVAEVHARTVGETAVVLGAGRKKKGDRVDPSVGILVEVKVGDQVTPGQTLFIIHASDEASLSEAQDSLQQAVKIVPHTVAPLPLFYGVVTE